MENSKIYLLIEYLSPTLILSYFFIHNIILVQIGILFSLYLININFINTLIRSLDKNLKIKNVSIDLDKIYKVTKSDSINIEQTKEDSKLTLVDTIEELGFIPSLNKCNDTEA